MCNNINNLQGDFMSEKQERVLDEIIKYYENNNSMPTIRYLQEKLHYKSTKAVYNHLQKLEKKNYLRRNENHKLVINNHSMKYHEGIKTINILNSTQKISLVLEKDKEYIGFILENNFFIDMHLMKNDLLIIEKNKKIKNNQLGLFIIDKKYRIMKYFYQDGFYILKDNEQIILNKINLIGTVILAERQIKNDK